MQSRFTNPKALAVIASVVAVAAAGCGGGSSSKTTTSKPPSSTPAAAATTSAPAASTTPSSSSSDLSGTWSGHYGGAFNGTFKLKWAQSGSKLTGTIKLSNPPSTPDINGSVSGSSIKFGTVGSEAITYSGSVSGNSMSGSYKTPSGGGPWSATKG